MKSNTNIIFIVLLLMLLFGGYFLYSQLQIPEVDTAFSSEQAYLLGQDFLKMVEKIKKVKISTEFLDTSLFESLEGSTSIIEVPQDIGRENPFLPI